jgi:hypothetical protein
MDERVRQILAVIDPLDRLPKPIKHRQLPGRHLIDCVFEQLLRGGDLLARTACE